MSYNSRAAVNAALAYRSAQREQTSITVPGYKQTSGEYPDPNYPFLTYIFTHDTDVYSAVNFLKNRALGRGTHIECSAQAPNYMKSECERYLEDWHKYIRWGDRRNQKGFERLSKIMFQEMGYAGGTILELLNPDDIRATISVQLSSIWKFERDYTGELQKIWQYPQQNPTPLDPERFAIINWNDVDKNPWGYGLAHSLAYPRVAPNGGSIPPVITTWWQMQDDARRRLHRQASPRAIIGVPNLDETQAKPMAEALKDPEADATFLANTSPSIVLDSPTQRGNFDPEFQLIRNRMDIGLNALLSVMLASDKKFAYNSARVGQDISDIIVWDLQHSFASGWNLQILGPVAEQAGFDVNLLQPELKYNIPDEVQEFTIADVLNAAKTVDPITGRPLISIEEARETIKQLAHWPLSDMLPSPPPAPLPQPAPGGIPMGTQPAAPLAPMGPRTQLS